MPRNIRPWERRSGKKLQWHSIIQVLFNKRRDFLSRPVALFYIRTPISPWFIVHSSGLLHCHLKNGLERMSTLPWNFTRRTLCYIWERKEWEIPFEGIIPLFVWKPKSRYPVWSEIETALPLQCLFEVTERNHWNTSVDTDPIIT